MGEKQSKGSAGDTPETDANNAIKHDSSDKKPSSKAKSAKTGDATAAEGFNIYGLPDDLRKQIGAEWLTIDDTIKAERAVAPILDKHKTITLFKPILTELEAAYYVLTGRPELLLRTLTKNPDLFFKPCIQIKDAAGQIFHNVSAADLINFVCDDDMQTQVATFASGLPTTECQLFVERWEKQRASRGRGGADLVKLTRDPMTQPFKAVLESTQTYNNWGETSQATFSLLKNPDGILYYIDANKKEHWYYANKDKGTIEHIEIPAALLTQHQDTYDQLKLVMDSMEPDSAKRSSNEEHHLIQALMRHSTTNKAIRLVREGIHYTQDGIVYRDTHYDFNRMYNVYRKCIRLRVPGSYDEADTVWRGEHAHRISEVMCVVQRLCEENRPFNPNADFNTPALFNRSVKVKDWYTEETVVLFDARAGVFHDGFGDNSNSGFSIFKDPMDHVASCVWRVSWGPARALVVDLIAVHRRMEDANKNVDEFKLNVVLSRGLTL